MIKPGRIGSAHYNRYKSIEVKERKREIDDLLTNRPLKGKDHSNGSQAGFEEEDSQVYFNDYE